MSVSDQCPGGLIGGNDHLKCPRCKIVQCLIIFNVAVISFYSIPTLISKNSACCAGVVKYIGILKNAYIGSMSFKVPLDHMCIVQSTPLHKTFQFIYKFKHF